MRVIRRVECSACGSPWCDHPTVALEAGWSTACPDGRAVEVEYVPASQLRGAVVALRAARSNLVRNGQPDGDGARRAVDIIDRALGDGPREWGQS